MKTSSFFCGLLLGATASMIMSRKRPLLKSVLGQGPAAGKAKDKIIDMALTGFGNSACNSSAGSAQEHRTDTVKQESGLKSKESNLKLLKDFIRSNPDVKHEVEQILRETHTTVPGL